MRSASGHWALVDASPAVDEQMSPVPEGRSPGRRSPSAALLASSRLRVSNDVALPADVPASVQRAVHRTVQEALANVRKHARALPSAPPRVPRRPGSTCASRTGVGLLGLRERAELLDGRFHAEPALNGGWALKAW